MDEQTNDGGDTPDQGDMQPRQPRQDFRRNQGGNGNGYPQGDRVFYDVNEQCSKCGAEITKLPFKPDPAKKDRLQCRDCYRQNRPFRR